MSQGGAIAQVIDAVIVLTLLECAALLLHHRATGQGVAPRDFLLNMVAGLGLMLALRCAARDAGPALVALCLLGAGLAHGADIAIRWRRRTRAEAEAAAGRVTA